MIFSFLRTGDSIEGRLEYNTSRYSKTTIAKIFNHYTHGLMASLPALDTPIMGIEIMSKEEKEAVIAMSAGISEDFPGFINPCTVGLKPKQRKYPNSPHWYLKNKR